MRELLLKKKREKCVVKYVLRKYSVGVVSVAISVSLISPVAAAAVQENGINATVIQEVFNVEDTITIKEDNIDINDVQETSSENDSMDINDNTKEEITVQEVRDKEESIVTTAEVIEETNEENIQTTMLDSDLNTIVTELKKINYEDLYDVLDVKVKSLDEFNIKLQLKKELGTDPSDAQVKERVKSIYMNKLDLKRSYENVQNNLEGTLRKVFDKSLGSDINYVLNNKYKILIGLTYLERQYSFDFNGISAKDLILYNSGLTGIDNNALGNLISIGNLNYTNLELKYNVNTFNKVIKPITNETSITSFIENALKVYAPNMTPSEWFKKQSKAYIVETVSIYGDTSLYSKLKNDINLQNNLIPLLTLSEDNIYAISTIKTVNYGLVDTYVDRQDASTMADFKIQLEKIAKEQEAFLNVWYRISNVKDKLSQRNNIAVIDTMQKYGKGKDAQSLWSPETGDDALSGVREFMTPLGYYIKYMFAGGQASGENLVNFYVSKSLTETGQSVYTHELTHLLDNSIFLNGYKRRDGKGVEVFARGIFESLNNTVGTSEYEPIFNLNLIYELGEGRVQNASPTRFNTEDDLQEYMQGLMDVLYTLDYAEAQSSLSKTDEEKTILFNQLELTTDSSNANKVNDTFKNIDTYTASKLSTINDLISNNIVVGRFAYQGVLTTGTAADNGYYVVPLFNPIYAAMQNNTGAVGDITFKRNAYELLAEYGYSNGMVAYISNQYANDQEALNAILASKYNGNLSEFKKDMFARRISKLSNLKETNYFANYEELQKLMDEAVAQDLAQMKYNKQYNITITSKVTAVKNLKTKILQWYLTNTNDFKTSIYENNIIVSEDKEISETAIPVTTTNATDDSLWEDETYTVKGTAGVLKTTKVWKMENGIRVGEPTVTTEITKEMKPTVVYTGTKKIAGEIITVDDNVAIPVTVVEVEDFNLYVGESRTETGVAGIKKVTTTQKTEKDKPVGEAVVTEEVVKEMVPTIIYKGTKALPVKDDVNTGSGDLDNSSSQGNSNNSQGNSTVNNSDKVNGVSGTGSSSNGIIVSNNGTESSTVSIVENVGQSSSVSEADESKTFNSTEQVAENGVQASKVEEVKEAEENISVTSDTEDNEDTAKSSDNKSDKKNLVEDAKEEKKESSKAPIYVALSALCAAVLGVFGFKLIKK